MRDFFADYDKTKPKDEPKEEETKDIGDIRKMVGIEVKKAMDSFLEKLESKAEPKDEQKDEQKEKEKEEE